MEPTIRSPYERRDREFVYGQGGKYFMRASREGVGVEVPKQVANTINIAVTGARRGPLRNINCHRVALYALGLIRKDDPRHGTQNYPDYQYPLFPFDEFEAFSTTKALKSFIQSKIGDSLGVVQVSGYVDHEKTRIGRRGEENMYPTVAHTLVARFNSAGNLVCFEQENYKRPARVTNIEEIFNRYQEYGYQYYWNARRADELDTASEVASMRADLDAEKNRSIRQRTR